MSTVRTPYSLQTVAALTVLLLLCAAPSQAAWYANEFTTNASGIARQLTTNIATSAVGQLTNVKLTEFTTNNWWAQAIVNTNIIVAPLPVGANSSLTWSNLQWALDQLTNTTADARQGRGVLFIPAGTYYVNNTLVIRNNGVKIVGAGPERTLIFASVDDKNVFEWQPTNSSYGGTWAYWLTVEDLSVRKNQKNYTQSQSAAFKLAPWNQNYSGHVCFRNLYVAGFYYGFYVSNAWDYIFEHVYAYGCNHSFWLSKVDACTLISCEAGDAYNVTYRTNWSGAPYSSGIEYINGGFQLVLINCEGRRADNFLHVGSGTIGVFISGLNLEEMWTGPHMRFDGGESVVIQNVRMARGSTNYNPRFKFTYAGTTASIIGFFPTDNINAWPEIEVPNSTFNLHYYGKYAVIVTNAATGQKTWVPHYISTTAGISFTNTPLYATHIISTQGFKLPQLSSIPTNVIDTAGTTTNWVLANVAGQLKLIATNKSAASSYLIRNLPAITIANLGGNGPTSPGAFVGDMVLDIYNDYNYLWIWDGELWRGVNNY